VCIKRNAVTQGCPVTVLNVEMILCKLLSRKRGHRTEKRGCPSIQDQCTWEKPAERKRNEVGR
jgi:hypothetical protein